MSVDVTMPRLSDSMEEGTILQWLKSPGDDVKSGDPIAEIETDKATMTYEADAEGVLLEILVGDGETAPLGAVIARIGAAGSVVNGGASAPAAAQPAPVAAQSAPAAPAPAAAGAPAPSADGRKEREKVSPLARRIAADLGVDLAGLAPGSGPGGRIVKADVEAAAKRTAPAPAAATAPAPSPAAASAPGAPAATDAGGEGGAKGDRTIVELTRVQQRVARRMSESKATIPEFTLFTDVDMTACVELRKQLKAIATPAPSYNDMIVKAAAIALTEFPRANGSYSDGTFVLNGRVNVGIAVAAEDSLVVPTVFDAHSKSLGAIAADARRLAGAVREGTITASELSGGTFTVSNLGMYGVSSFGAIINPPQAAILSVGAIERRAVVADDDQIVARDVLTLGLICDHRILYGADAAQFLARIRELLTTPLAMAL